MHRQLRSSDTGNAFCKYTSASPLHEQESKLVEQMPTHSHADKAPPSEELHGIFYYIDRLLCFNLSISIY